VELVAWGVLGVTVVASAALVNRTPRALRWGVVALALLFVPAGALVNAAYLLDGRDYAGFADASWSPFVTETWQSVVVPHHHLFIGVLVVFELVVGVLVLVPGLPRRVALAAMIAFHVALLAFGWAFAVWTVPMVWALARLLRAEVARAGGETPTGPGDPLTPRRARRSGSRRLRVG
jgi:hypothetical protein